MASGLDMQDHEALDPDRQDLDFPTVFAPDVELTETGPKQSRKPRPDAEDVDAKPSVTTYDPKTLLSPRGASGSAKNGSSGTVKAESVGDNVPSANEGGLGMSQYLETTHRLTNREAQSRLKRKAIPGDEEDEERKKPKFDAIGGRNGGILGEHMKKEREQAAKDELPAPENLPIDLTNEPDEEVQFIADSGTREVCLGMILTPINASRTPSLTPGSLNKLGANWWPKARIELRRVQGANNIIHAIDRAGSKFGQLTFQVAQALCPLLDGRSVSKLRMKTYLETRKRTPDDVPGKAISAQLGARTTFYAPRGKADAIGRFMSQKQLFFLNPVEVEPSVQIYNPHTPQVFAGKPGTSQTGARPQHSAPGRFNERTQEEMRRDADDMFASLYKSSESLQGAEADSSRISTPLMEHQKKALRFLLDHERSDFDFAEDSPDWSLWRPRNKAFYNVITGEEISKKPDPVHGGILADVMGLGKTLSILALMAATFQDGRSFGHKNSSTENENIERNSRATLIICPKSVMSNWHEQIKAHTTSGAFKVYAYHGSTRSQDVDFVGRHDIVLTTYNTAAAEFSDGTRKKRTLAAIKWFRIVLDEAHQIRNQGTQVSKACCDLAAERRWAVTGTPVQNTLDDLGSLIKFLRIKPFDEPRNWAQHIHAPFKNGNIDVVQHLRLLVDSITLRRTKNTVAGIGKRHEEQEVVHFEDDERAVYREFAKQANLRLRNMTSESGRLQGKAYAHVLKSISRLRALCAHGKEMLSEEDRKAMDGVTESTPIELFDEPDGNGNPQGEPFVSDKDAYEAFSEMKDADQNVCVRCANKVGGSVEAQSTSRGVIDLSDSSNESDDVDSSDDERVVRSKNTDHMGRLTQGCYHLICPRCEQTHDENINATQTADGYYKCPFDEAYVRCANFELTRSGLQDYYDERENAAKRGKRAKWETREHYGGQHSKVKALITHLKKSELETAELPEDEPPIRSVVFSGWTSYLDLIEFALEDEGIGFTRLDGSMSIKKRTKVLQDFKTDPSITVLLVSIKAGGQGLNFTAANKVYMMEPQFNPGVEQQAIDRVHRLGQERDVEIVHFIMEDSIEGGILGLQKKKEKLAALAVDKKRTRQEDAKQRIDELKSLFK